MRRRRAHVIPLLLALVSGCYSIGLIITKQYTTAIYFVLLAMLILLLGDHV